MEERLRFIAAVPADDESMTVVCEQFGISRKTGYKWLSRYRAPGASGLEELSHAPQQVPWAISQAQAEAIIGLREVHPSWGPKQILPV